ncbi:uncharacterized protein LOC117315906 [Pecten maximus]|uniref:uncharacterized protein LOC117315906 n=1 Tax=Pecten maximus TaxID=6579 RepID=UPI0014590269|nr:uncharacterized protein LOC117315906 [Pecten maximus]
MGFQKTNKSTTIWTCSIRSKTIHCYATIVAKGTQFNRGPQEHVHPPEPRKTAKAKVTHVFVLMSRRRKSDYVRVLTAIRDRLGDCQVEQCMLDFEQAAWQSIREVFPGVNLRGCIFHLTQELWRHIQELRLSRTYREREPPTTSSG